MENLINQLVVLAASGLGVYASTLLASKLNLVKKSAKTKAIKRGIAGVLAAVAVVLMKEGDIQPESVQQVIVSLVEFASIWYTAHVIHKEIEVTAKADK